MAPRRPRSTSNAAANIPRAPTSSPLLRKQIAVASDSIYNNNLTVLKRRDPTIVSIIDQFSHVCLYNYNGRTQKWTKEGFEGSMFIVEHVDEPIYGIFVLNRMGTGDYIRRIYTEDDMEVFGKYLMYRYYPDFTQKRLAMNLPYPIPDQYRPTFDAEFATDNSEQDDPDPTKKRKRQGNSITLGIWAFQQEAHEPLEDVMMRLREYIKRGERYPEQFRFIPGRQAPPSNKLNQPNFPMPTLSDAHSAQSLHGPPMHASYQGGMASEPSEVDKLFAKLQPSHLPAAAPALPAASSRTVESWFAALAGQGTSSQNAAAQQVSTSHAALSPFAPMNPAQSTRGLSLLDSIFASVSQPGSAAGSSYDLHVQAHQLPPNPEEIQIVSPKPQSSTLPQILNQNVISSLLGLSPVSTGSRSSSAALSSNSSQRSGAKRYEGDNESSENELVSEGGYSASSTVLDPDADPAVLSRGSPYNLPAVSYSDHANGVGLPVTAVQGDVTPRAGLRGICPSSPSLTPQRSGEPFLAVPPSHPGSTSSPASGDASSTRQRTLVPFSSDHELWPYPRPPLNETDQTSDAEVVELDFSDTRALSDPSIFQEKQAKQVKGERKRKSRKERAAEREKEREAIENGWDDPMKGQVTLTPAATSSSITSAQTDATTAPTPTHANGTTKLPINGHGNNEPIAAHVNGANGAAKTAADVAREALLASLSAYPQSPARDLSRKQFVQEVLSLIYSDNNFVDRLYQEYCSPTHA